MEYSQASTASTIPYELTLHADPDFIDELEVVNNLFFGNREEFFEEVHPDQNDSDSDDADHPQSTSDERVGEYFDPEALKEDRFFIDTCGCTKHDGKPCTSVLGRGFIISYRLSMLEKTKQELDLIIKAQLFQHRSSTNVTSRGKDRQRPTQSYYFGGKSVCRELFAFAHGICRRTVEVIGRSLDVCGLEERVHGNANKVPKHALTIDEVSYVKSFLSHYATQNGVPLPGRTSHHRDLKAILLPSDRNKADIYSLLCEAVESADLRLRKISLRTFYKLWQEHCPQIYVMQPATDLCTTCQKHAQQLMNSGNCTEEEKQEKMASYNRHLEKVQCQRQNYRDNLEHSKEAFECLSPERKVRGQVPCSVDTPVVYSFDFAQQVLYPHYAQQVGPVFFKTPRKCQCFGVCCESSGSQIFYLIDEGKGAGKGANSVTSMLHHHFQVHGYGEQHVQLNMDNCTGQNKNNTVIGYFLWRTLTGAHQTVEISLMEAGHTKFSPDWHFGLWKVRWRHSSAESMADIAETVRRSSRKGHNQPQVVDDQENPVSFFDWKSFLKGFFRVLPNITKYHYFRMSSTEPGTVYMREYMFSKEVSFKASKPSVSVCGFPERIDPPGLDSARQWYLFDEIGPLCRNSGNACPRPTTPRPRPYKSEKVVSKHE